MSSTQQLLLGEGAGGAAPVYIEDVFSTYLYTGTGATLAINNGIDLSTKGGLVWQKVRSSAGYRHFLFDTVRGVNKYISTNTTDAQATQASSLTSFNSNGFTLGSDSNVNGSGIDSVSWTFREQPKFFDIVTYTGTGSARTIAHNLGSVPGCIIVKCTDAVGKSWSVYHRSQGATKFGVLNSTNAFATSSTYWNDTTPTDTVFSLGTAGVVNDVGDTFVAYLFAHDAGGFGAAGTDNVISCGSFTTDGSGNATVNLGYEPQWLMTKTASTASSGAWYMQDNMRGWVHNDPGSNNNKLLYANTNEAEGGGGFASLTATGFTFGSSGYGPWANATFIYVACRRGPMKVPTVGTSVFTPIYQTPQSAGTLRTVGFPADLMIGTYTAAATPRYVNTRLLGLANNSGASQTTPKLATDSTAAQADAYPLFYNVWNTTARDGDYIFGSNGINWLFGRAPSVFDVVCYTGDNVNGRVLDHNLGVAAEFVIQKKRSGTSSWAATVLSQTYSLILNTTDSGPNIANKYTTASSSTTFTIKSSFNGDPDTYVAYLFATCAGVSKVGSYTGTGALQTINCGFTSGARFILIKRYDSTGDWYVWDSARGISSGNDPYSLLNSAGAQVAGTNYVDTTSVGFQVTAAAPSELNANGGTFVFLAVA